MPTLHPCPALLAARGEAARLACPASWSCGTIDSRRGHCRFRDVLRHGEEPRAFGAESLARLLDLERCGSLVHEESPQLFVYRQACWGVRAMGVVGTCAVAELGLPGSGAPIQIPEREGDDAARMSTFLEAVGAHLEPTVAAVAHCDDLEEILRRETNERPLMHFVGHDGATHTVWAVRDPSTVMESIAHAGAATVISNAQAACAARLVGHPNGCGDRLTHDHGARPRDGGDAAERQVGHASERTGRLENAEAARALVVILPDSVIGDGPIDLLIDGASPEEIAGELGKTLGAAPQLGGFPELGELGELGKSGTLGETSRLSPGFVVVVTPQGGMLVQLRRSDGRPDVAQIDARLRELGLTYRPCPRLPTTATEAEDERPERVLDGDAVRVRLAPLTLADLRGSLASATRADEGLPPCCCWLPPYPPNGLFVHPFRWPDGH